MDIEKLKLTGKELMEGPWVMYGEYPDGYQEIADAQLAKAVWGLVDQLFSKGIKENQKDQLLFSTAYGLVASQLAVEAEAAGIPRPDVQ